MDVKKPRLENTTIACPIIYGSIAFYLGKPRNNEAATHKWSLFVRGPNDEDLTTFISKVTFVLHPSFEISERGKLSIILNFSFMKYLNV